jgi:type VI secretion system secreted protein VgrG
MKTAAMPLNVTLSFPTSAAPAAALKVRRYDLRQSMSEPFELVLQVLSTDPAMPESAVAGQTVVAAFADEPFVKAVRGIVRQVEQRTAVPDGDSLYVWTVVPPVWLTTRRRDHRVFQSLSVPDIVAAVLADASYGGRVDPPARLLDGHEPCEYVVQYAETDWDFLSRILADEGIASFFDHENGSAWTLIDDTAASAPDLTDGAIPFADPSHMNDSAAPHVQTAVVRTCIETSAVTLRDYDFEKPAFKLEANKATDPGATFTNEAPLEAYTFEVGKFAVQAPGDARAARVLEADRADRRRVICTASFTLPPGTRMSMVDHPRDDLDAAFLVVRACTVVDLDRERTHELELMDLAQRFRPPLRPKARVHGTQTAFVMSSNGEEIDVDNYGRVLIEHPWDRRDAAAGATSRRVRVSQGWAGEGYGFVAPPRRGDEVIVAYLDGDPDQPLIVGRVHNAVSTTPLNLPAERTRSIWKSRSTPGGGGFNAIVMEDAAGSELFSIKAQRDHQTNVGNDASTVVVGDVTEQVGGDRRVTVAGNHQTAIGGTRRIGVKGPQFVDAGDTTFNGKKIDATATEVWLDAERVAVTADSIHLTSDGIVMIEGKTILLKAGGSTIEMSDGSVVIKSPLIELNP